MSVEYGEILYAYFLIYVKIISIDIYMKYNNLFYFRFNAKLFILLKLINYVCKQFGSTKCSRKNMGNY